MRWIPLLLLMVVMGACADDGEPRDEAGPADELVLFPDVIDALALQGDDGTWTFTVTMSSPYDSAERYADAWRVVGPDGETIGARDLAHDHATEQPFTRSLAGVEISDDIAAVTIEGRDQLSGWGGDTVEVVLR